MPLCTVLPQEGDHEEPGTCHSCSFPPYCRRMSGQNGRRRCIPVTCNVCTACSRKGREREDGWNEGTREREEDGAREKIAGGDRSRKQTGRSSG
eukprot:7194922-Pyramimonas_sp.AAC.1